MKRIIILTIAILLVIPFVISTTDDIRFIAQQETALDITEPCFNNNTYCSSDSACNLTVKDPAQKVLIDNLLMTNQGAYHNYTLSSYHLNDTGVYEATAICMDGIYNGYDNFYFKITYHGREEPAGFTQVIFIIAFVILLAGFLFSILLLVQHLERMDFDLLDLIIMIGIYFGVFCMKYFNLQYMGSSMIDRFVDIFISVGGFTHILTPITIFIYCLVRRRMEQKEENV